MSKGDCGLMAIRGVLSEFVERECNGQVYCWGKLRLKERQGDSTGWCGEVWSARSNILSGLICMFWRQILQRRSISMNLILKF
jgi:hypothetical protein